MKISISFGVTVIAAIVIFCGSYDLVLPMLSAAAIHEAGHIIAILLQGGNISNFTVNAGGLKISYDSYRFTYAQDLICALSGPVVGIIAAVLGANIGLPVFAGISLCLSVFNLLPIRPLDGGKIVWSFFMMLSVKNSDKLMTIIEIIFLAILNVISLYIFAISGSFNLTLLTAVLTFYYCKER